MTKKQELDELRLVLIFKLKEHLRIWGQLELLRCANRLSCSEIDRLEKQIEEKIKEVDAENAKDELSLGI